jgi:hypothetical protein
MKKAAAHTTILHHGQKITTVKPQMLDTVVRIVAPVAALTAVGVLADGRFDSKPWLALLGLAAGCVLAGVLVKRQDSDLPDEEN